MRPSRNGRTLIAAPESPAVLRPLSIGELLDRAVTLFVRNFWLFCGLTAVLYVPLTLAQSLMGDFWLQYASILGKVFSSPGKPPDVAGDVGILQRVDAVALLEFLVWIIAAPLAAAALTHAAAELAEGRTPSFRDSVRFALRRWLGVWLFFIMASFLLGALFFAGYIGLTLLTLLTVLVLHTIVVSVVLGILVLTIWLGILMVGFIATSIGFVTFIVEAGNAPHAFAAGLERVLNRGSLWRSLLVGLIDAAVGVGFSIVAYAAGFGLLYLLHTGIPMILIAAIASLMQFGFSILIVVLYYFDLRARREGRDLALMATQVAASR